MNKDLLFQLYAIHSPSGREKKMRKFVKRYIKKNCGACEVEQDALGNMFVTKGYADSYPCLASHLDQVQDDHSKDFECVEGKDVVFGYSHKAHEQQGLGADDKNGIWICLECLKKYDVLKVAFFVSEETGCQGSSRCDLSFFADCKYIIQPDRRGGHDLITNMFCGDVCSDEFASALDSDLYGYRECTGSVTDVGELVERGVGISCLNVSCGYYEAHTDQEFTVLSELQNCFDFVCHIIEKLTEKCYPFEYTGRGYGRCSGYGSYYVGYGKSQPKIIKRDARISYYDDCFYDEDYEMMCELLHNNKNLTFEDIVGAGGYISNFYTRDVNVLKDLYDDAVYSLGLELDEDGEIQFQLDEEKEDKDDEEMNFDDVVFPTKKVS